MNEKRPGNDDVLLALNAVAETLGAEGQPLPADSAAMAQSGPHAPGNPEGSGSGVGNGGDKEATPPPVSPGDSGRTPPPPTNRPPGGAAEWENPDESSQGVWLSLPDGRAVNINDLLDRSRATGEATISAGVLKAGDLVMFNAPPEEGSDRERGIVFEVSGTEWANIAPGALPQALVKGRLRGLGLPSEATQGEVEFLGSGFGYSSIRNNVLTTDLPPYFEGSERQEIILEGYHYAETFRPSETGIDNLDPNQLDRQAGIDNPRHAAGVEQLAALGAAHGFDIRQSTVVDPVVVRADARGGASYNADRYSGNVFTTLERDGSTWIQARYVNDDGRDLLQISAASMTGRDMRDTFAYGIHATDRVNASGAAIATYTTSNRLGIDVVQFQPSVEDTAQQLGMPLHPAGFIPRVKINVTPDGQATLDTTGPARVVLRDHPGLAERIEAAIRTEITPEGETAVTVGSERYILAKPEALLQRMADMIRGE